MRNVLVDRFVAAQEAVTPLRAATRAGIMARCEVAYLVSLTMEGCVIHDQTWLGFSA